MGNDYYGGWKPRKKKKPVKKAEFLLWCESDGEYIDTLTATEKDAIARAKEESVDRDQAVTLYRKIGIVETPNKPVDRVYKPVK